MLSPRQFAERLARASGMVQPAIEEMVVATVKLAEARAKAMIGTDHEGWEPLSSATLYGFYHPMARKYIPGKLELGYPAEPLLRTGEARESIVGLAEGDTGLVGSDSKKLLWSEFGTNNQFYPEPARPIFAEALTDTLPELEVMAAEVVVRLLTAD